MQAQLTLLSDSIAHNDYENCKLLLENKDLVVFDEDYDFFLDAMSYCDLDIVELFTSHPEFNPNHLNGFFFDFAINNSLFKKSKLFLKHPNFNPNENQSSLLNVLMSVDKYDLFIELSSFKNISLNYGDNTLLQSACFSKNKKYFYFLLKNKSVMANITEKWINDWIQQEYKEELMKSLKIFNF